MSKIRKPKLTNGDHSNMDAFLGFVLEDFKSGSISKGEAVAAIAHTVAAVDIGNYNEARIWFEQGRKFIKESPLRLKRTT
jgi:hypothetical protein